MTKVWTALVALFKLVWYAIENAAEVIRQQKALREASDARAAELEAQRAAQVAKDREEDVREAEGIVAAGDADAAGEFLRQSFRDN